MNQLEVGTIKTLTVTRKIETGYVLTSGKEEVLLHARETEGDLDEGQEVDAFLYQDKKGQLVATTIIPDIHRYTYGWAEVVESVKNLGVFVNIGIQKEILVSKDDLPLLEGVWPQKGDQLFVTLIVDNKGRLLAKPVTEDIIEQERDRAQKHLKNQQTSGRVYRSTKVGSFIITEEGYRGFVHHSERKEEPRLGEWVEGRIIEVKDDGTINVSLRPVKEKGIEVDAEEILAYLKDQGGVIPFSDNSDPEEIRQTFHISKGAFKRALGKLLKEGMIEQRDGKTYLK
ncbi:putative RNA-binding protein (virulence factor B family) [Evansella vedderi]|uniref:RNA-binding protein (Virulence factor B family) n=1 Tax=Evansella vedderi TaxID=38282 RepID=A0ABU0A340_9BACI|nr:S1-like domain-containing RNA-binding protein [Evansella vedderi]MDQ0257910.1 putative RNA-binding protein (virulence factor B family) [Evansella vedderi]